jgi:hypothetical protein
MERLSAYSHVQAIPLRRKASAVNEGLSHLLKGHLEEVCTNAGVQCEEVEVSHTTKNTQLEGFIQVEFKMTLIVSQLRQKTLEERIDEAWKAAEAKECMDIPMHVTTTINGETVQKTIPGTLTKIPEVAEEDEYVASVTGKTPRYAPTAALPLPQPVGLGLARAMASTQFMSRALRARMPE